MIVFFSFLLATLFVLVAAIRIITVKYLLSLYLKWSSVYHYILLLIRMIILSRLGHLAFGVLFLKSHSFSFNRYAQTLMLSLTILANTNH